MDYAARHKGYVTAVSSDLTVVDVTLDDSAADCGGCALHGLCSPKQTDRSGADVVTVRASVGNLPVPSVGAAVEVGLPDKVRWLSTAVVLIAPVLVFVVTLLSVLAFGGCQAVAAVSALVATALYFVALVPLRPKLAARSHWRLIDG